MPAHQRPHSPSQTAGGLPPDPVSRSARRTIATILPLASLAALALYAAFPPIGAWPLALLIVPPLIVAGLVAHRARLAAAVVFAAFVPAYAALHYWIWDNHVSRVGYPILAAILAAYPAIFVAGLVVVRRRAGALASLAFAPAWWIGLEALRGEVLFTGYPWYLTGVPLIDAPIVWRGGPYDAGLISISLSAPALLLLPPLRRSVIRGMDGSGAWRFAVPTMLALSVALATLLGGWLPEHPHGLRAQSGSAAHSDAGGHADGRSPNGGRSVVVGIVQTNVPQDNRADWLLHQRLEDFNRFIVLTLLASRTSTIDPESGAARSPDFIVWPETMYPGFFGLTPEAIAILNETALELAGVPLSLFPNDMLRLSSVAGVPLVIGATVQHGFQPIDLPIPDDPGGRSIPWLDSARLYNSAFVLRDGAVDSQRYDKIDLTPFGEAIPYLQNRPALKQWITNLGATGMAFDLEPAREARRLVIPTRSAGPVALATPICFEATLGRATRRLALDEHRRLAIDLLINMTNDGWFGSLPGGQDTHLLHARWRASELRTPLLRAANTGVSAWIDADGKVRQRGPTHTVDPSGKRATPTNPADPVVNVDGFLLVEVPLRRLEAGAADRPTPGPLSFARRGNLPAAICLLGSGLVLVLLLLGRHPGRGAPRHFEQH